MQKSMTVGHSYLSKISTGTGKASLIKNKYARHIWVKALFLIGLACLIIIASAVIVTLGQVSMTVSQAYHAIVNWIVPGIFSVNPLDNGKIGR
ncbi:MAG TPA: hypothetical protein DCO75_04105, partial [Fibrobacteres bacterium]|nr:hypothetical protein [Fibrobacterota bacterium]